MKFTLHRDYETKSTADLKKVGTAVYASHPSTDAWCCSYAVNNEPVKLWTPDKPVPDEFKEAARNPEWEVVAFNDAFEATIEERMLSRRYGWPVVPIERHRCVMAEALAMALPGSLANVAAALGIERGKDMDGHSLMLRMSQPRRPRKGENPDGIYWFDDEERKQRLYQYCVTDTETEREVERRLLRLRPSEQRLWVLDAQINARGVYVDAELCTAALKVVGQASKWLNEELREITNGAANSTTNVAQISGWLREHGLVVESLDKAHIEDLLMQPELSPEVRRVLEIRQEGAKGAVKKIDALVAGRNDDGRARGLLQFHQASTGRWAGRRFQPQNLPRGSGANADEIVETLKLGDAELVRMLHDEPLTAVSDCLRGLVIAEPGNELLVGDFSGIEGRVGAWLADEEWKLQVFRDYDAGVGPNAYLVTSAAIYNVPVETLTKKSPEYQPGKVCELAFLFQGGVGAWRKFEKTADDMPVFPDEQVNEFKDAWRTKHSNIQQYWYDLERAAKSAIWNRGEVFYAGRIAFRCAGSFLFMRLPSGRSICYPYPDIRDKMTPWGENRPQVSYMGVDSYTRKWMRCFAHGGLLFNNAVQGTARDIEAEAMVRLDAAGYLIILTVHDEVVCEVEKGSRELSEFEKMMVALPTWADGLPVAAEAWKGGRYRK